MPEVKGREGEGKKKETDIDPEAEEDSQTPDYPDRKGVLVSPAFRFWKKSLTIAPCLLKGAQAPAPVNQAPQEGLPSHLQLCSPGPAQSPTHRSKG